MADDEAQQVTVDASGQPPRVTLDGFKIKGLLKDPDAMILYGLLALYLLVPEAWRVQAVDRLDDPLALTLLAVATGGRFGVRAAGALSAGRAAATIGPELVRHETIWASGEPHVDPTPAVQYPQTNDIGGPILPKGE